MTNNELVQRYKELAPGIPFMEFVRLENLNNKINDNCIPRGTFRFYELELNPSHQAKLKNGEHDVLSRDLDNHKVAEFDNQILQTGLLTYINRFHDSIGGIQCGTGGNIASTFTTQQAHQAPLANLVFRREGIAQESSVLSTGNIVGWRYTYPFVRPASSYGGTTINEIGILVSKLDSTSSLLCRLIGGTGAGMTSALPHTFSSTLDTLCFYDIEFIAGS